MFFQHFLKRFVHPVCKLIPHVPNIAALGEGPASVRAKMVHARNPVVNVHLRTFHKGGAPGIVKALDAMMRSDFDKWGRVVKSTGFSIDS